MAELAWFELSLPRDMDLGQVTAVLRPLASRPRLGLTAVTPLVALEAWSHGGVVSWRLGADARIARRLPDDLAAHLPRLGITRMASGRRQLTLAADLYMDGVVGSLRSDTAGAVSAGLLAALGHVGPGEAAVVQWLVGPGRSGQVPPESLDWMEAFGFRSPDRPDSTARRLWRDKTVEPLFACRGRVGALAATPARAFAVVRSLGDACKLANTAATRLRVGKAMRSRAAKAVSAAPSLRWSCLLNAVELATLLGWPIGGAGRDDLPLVGGHINPAPRQLLVPADDGDKSDARLLGESLYAAQRGDLVRVPVKTSLHHLQVIGPTGSGKSTLLASLITADIAAGRSVLVVEPRGDLISDVLARVPRDKRDRVVVIDPANADRVVGVNVLAGDRAHAERRADEMVHLLAELHGGNLGPRSTDVLMHALITASRLPDGTLCDVPILLTNPAFRRAALTKVSDPLVLGPWWAGFDALTDPERGRYVAPLMNKLRPITGRDSLRRMLGQADPLFDLADMFTTPGTVVLVNLNRGLLGTPTANLLGALILSQAWAAIQRRAATAPKDRHPAMVIVDEFQDFLRLPGGVDFGDALAQSRGLGVSWTLAHQHMDQLSSAQQSGVLANARSRIVFRPAPGDAKPLAAALGGGVSGDDLLRLRAFEACVSLLVDGHPTRPLSVRTRPLGPWTGNPDRLRTASQNRYGADGADVDAALQRRWHTSAGPATGPVGARPRRAP